MLKKSMAKAKIGLGCQNAETEPAGCTVSTVVLYSNIIAVYVLYVATAVHIIPKGCADILTKCTGNAAGAVFKLVRVASAAFILETTKLVGLW